MRIVVLCFVFVSFIIGCTTPSKNKFSDPILIKIANLQDRRNTDSLILFLLDKNPKYRSEAALALASIQDSAASLQLGTTLLEDPIEEARINSAFALGQISGFAAVNALIPALSDTSSKVINEVLQALGKATTKIDLSSLVDYTPEDSLQLVGQSWAFYYAGIRGVTSTKMESKAVDFLSFRNPTSVRLGASHFFNRTGSINNLPINELIKSATEDPDVEVRMAATLALRKSNSNECAAALEKILTNENDYRVRVNAARASTFISDSERDKIALKALEDENELVVITAAESIKDNFSMLEDLKTIADKTKSFRAKASLYKLLLPTTPTLLEEIKNTISHSNNEYEKAAFISALSSDINSHQFLLDQLLVSKVPVVKTASASALVSMNRKNVLNTDQKQEFAGIYKKALEDGDVGIISIVTNALADPTLDYKSIISDYSFLLEVKDKLVLPRDYEAYQPLEDAIAYFEGKNKPEAPKNNYNQPIDWDIVKSISSNQKVKIETNKGEIVLTLLVDETPGSVANFVELLQKNYFDDKFVHRVVPNFVIQTGCNRGDGYGSEDYSIRSEFSLRRYSEGSVGMASAGKDTEGTQWFITHSPTPHLNGKYSLFATVDQGMNIVHTLQVGDKILSVKLVDK